MEEAVWKKLDGSCVTVIQRSDLHSIVILFNYYVENLSD